MVPFYTFQDHVDSHVDNHVDSHVDSHVDKPSRTFHEILLVYFIWSFIPYFMINKNLTDFKSEMKLLILLHCMYFVFKNEAPDSAIYNINFYSVFI